MGHQALGGQRGWTRSSEARVHGEAAGPRAWRPGQRPLWVSPWASASTGTGGVAQSRSLRTVTGCGLVAVLSSASPSPGFSSQASLTLQPLVSRDYVRRGQGTGDRARHRRPSPARKGTARVAQRVGRGGRAVFPSRPSVAAAGSPGRWLCLPTPLQPGILLAFG